MESIIRDMIINHMKSNKLHSARQYEFISGRSTVLQLLTVMDKWYKILDEGGCIDVIYCDFIKAFDKVPHRRLLKKFWDIQEHLGVHNIISKQRKTESESKLRPFQEGGCYKWYTPRLSTRSPTICDLYKLLKYSYLPTT